MLAFTLSNQTINLGDGLYQRTYVGTNPAGATDVHKRYAFGGQMIAERQGNSVFFVVNDHLGGAVANFDASLILRCFTCDVNH